MTARWRQWAAATALAALASGCDLPGGLAGDRIDSGSALHDLRLADERPITDTIREPSDLAFDPETGTFWTVSDQRGTLHRIAPDGAAAGAAMDLEAKDLEGITFDPTTGHLFAVDEATSELIEATRDGAVVARVPVALPGRRANSGLEGIAYDPAKDGFVLVRERNPAEVIFVDRTGRVTGRASVRTQDLSAVAVRGDGGSLFVVARFEEAVLEVDRTGKVLNRLPLNMPGVEGLAFDDRGRLFAAADLGANARGMLYLFARAGGA
jgi:uncharacterized protein YjiK